MLLVNPIPGQEERNADYLVKNASAIKVKELKDLREKVTDYLEHPQELRKISQKMLKISTPRAANDSAQEILNVLEMDRTSLYETLHAN